MDALVLCLFLNFMPPLWFVRKPILAKANNKSIISLTLSIPLSPYSSMKATPDQLCTPLSVTYHQDLVPDTT